MIAVTRLDGAALVVNADLVEWIERTPDTMIALVNGEKILVRETPDQLVDRVIAFKRAIHAAPDVRVGQGSDDPAERSDG